MGDEEVAAVEGGVQVLYTSVDGSPPEAEVDTPIAAVPGALVSK